jgi:hypothetical protein
MTRFSENDVAMRRFRNEDGSSLVVEELEMAVLLNVALGCVSKRRASTFCLISI